MSSQTILRCVMSYEKALKDLYKCYIIPMFYFKYILYPCFNTVLAIATFQFPVCHCICVSAHASLS